MREQHEDFEAFKKHNGDILVHFKNIYLSCYNGLMCLIWAVAFITMLAGLSEQGWDIFAYGPLVWKEVCG